MQVILIRHVSKNGKTRNAIVAGMPKPLSQSISPGDETHQVIDKLCSKVRAMV